MIKAEKSMKYVVATAYVIWGMQGIVYALLGKEKWLAFGE
jgi:hypothetical protein